MYGCIWIFVYRVSMYAVMYNCVYAFSNATHISNNLNWLVNKYTCLSYNTVK